MQPAVLIAIGGNALIRAGGSPSVTSQRRHVADACRGIADVVAAGWRVVITHGNGPQVGAALLRSERTEAEVYPLPLDVCVASTQGEIGYLLQRALGEALDARNLQRPVVTLVTQVVVDSRDPAFMEPTKPIGPYYSDDEAGIRQRLGWTMVEGPPHRWRRVVASPEPGEIVEEALVRTLLNANAIVITLGGGGIPVVGEAGRLTGVEAVVDKDLASSLLATRLRLDRLVLATDVDRVYLDYGRPAARGLDRVTAADLRRHAAAGHFPPGTMGPKVEAAMRFVEHGGYEAVVTSSDRLIEALEGRAGTRVSARHL